MYIHSSPKKFFKKTELSSPLVSTPRWGETFTLKLQSVDYVDDLNVDMSLFSNLRNLRNEIVIFQLPG